MSDVITRVVDDAVELMERENWDVSYSTVADIVQQSYDAKDELRELFKKHPKYDADNDCIELISEFKRDVEYAPVEYLLSMMINALTYDCKAYKDFMRIKPDIYGYKWLYNCVDEKIAYRYPMIRDAYDEWLYGSDDGKLYRFVIKLRSMAIRCNLPQYISPELADYAKSLGLKGMNKGKKMSRVFHQLADIINDKQVYDQIVKACDGINQLVYKRKVVLSLNFIDFITMSLGNSWSSCHTTDKLQNIFPDNTGYTGCYCSGTMSYALDSTSFMYYELHENDYVYRHWDSVGKIRRCVFNYDVEQGLLVQGRVYPDDQSDMDKHDSNCYEPIRKIVQKAIDDCMGKGNGNWSSPISSRENSYECINTKGTHYPDYIHYNNPNITGREMGLMYKGNHITIGHNPICVTCGREHDERGQLSCCHPIRVEECYCCGSVDYEDSMFYSRKEGNWYCDGCCVLDDYLGDYVSEETRMVYVEGYGNVSEDEIEDAMWRGDIVYCATCSLYERYDSQIRDEFDDYHCDVENYVYDEDEDYYVLKGDEYDEVI